MSLRRVVGWSGELLVTLGVLLLLFAAWQLWWTDVVADRAQTQIVQSLEDEFARGTAAPVGDNGIPAAIGEDGAFAVVRIPRFSSTSQKGCPWRNSSTLSDPSGIWYLPSFSLLSEGSARLVDRYGTIVFGSRWMKS